MMSFKQFLKEKWVADIVLPMFGQPEAKPPVPVYENPTSSNQYIQEDFNSNGAKQFTLAVTNAPVGSMYVPVFFEKLPQKPFNLPRYMKTFHSSTAKETLKTEGNYRGLIFCVPPNYLVFIFSAELLHAFACSALGSKTGMGYPKNNYRKIYDVTQESGLHEISSDSWCFPFIYSPSGELSTILGPKALAATFPDNKLEKEFMIDSLKTKK